jgi:hypothetical protein
MLNGCLKLEQIAPFPFAHPAIFLLVAYGHELRPQSIFIA